MSFYFVISFYCFISRINKFSYLFDFIIDFNYIILPMMYNLAHVFHDYDVVFLIFVILELWIVQR